MPSTHTHPDLVQIVFVAPTRPLVAQQLEACRRIVGIPTECVAELLAVGPDKRAEVSTGLGFTGFLSIGLEGLHK